MSLFVSKISCNKTDNNAWEFVLVGVKIWGSPALLSKTN